LRVESGPLQLIGNVWGADRARKTKGLFIGYGRGDEHVPGLEYEKRFCAQRALAGPITFGMSLRWSVEIVAFGDRCRGFSSTCSTSTVRSHARLSDLL
jgi:hypothetical protein